MNMDEYNGSRLLNVKQQLDAKEADFLSGFATLSRDGIRRQTDAQAGHRQAFAIDADLNAGRGQLPEQGVGFHRDGPLGGAFAADDNRTG